MISDLMGIYKKFNTQQIKLISSNAEVLKELANEKKEANKNINTNKAILLAPPSAGFVIGVFSSILYSSNKNKELSRRIENYKDGLELGFDTSPLTQQINDSIKQSEDKIKKAQIENQNIKNAGHILDSIDARNAEIVEINNGIIKRETEFIGKMKTQLGDIRTKIVDFEFKKFSTNATATAKKQIKQFGIGIILALTAVGIIISYIIRRVKKNKSE